MIITSSRSATASNGATSLDDHVGIKLADEILCEVARQQGQDVEELAAQVVASCTTDSAVLPRVLYEAS